jgi:MFS family permease
MSGAIDTSLAANAASPYPARAVGWYATALLGFLYWLSVLDRFIISLLVEPIKRDLGISDLQFGLLTGFAFATTFSVFGLLFGALADRVSRRWVIFAGVSIWSLATATCGVAKNYVQLALARVGVGAGEAALNPCATSMLADLFPPHRLSLATAVYAMGATVGAGTAFLVGGMIVDLVSHSEFFVFPLLGEVRSWQAVFYIVGIPGVLISFAIFIIPEPVRRGPKLAATNGRSWMTAYVDLIQFMKKRPRLYVCHILGFGIASAVVSGGGSWYPVHMIRSFGWTPGKTGLALGLTMIAAALIGKSISGRLMDELYKRGFRDAQMRWYMGACLAAVPVGIITFTSGNPWVFLGGFWIYMVLIQTLPICAYTTLNLVTPNNLRGASVAFFGAIGGIIGAGLGPILIPAAAKFIFKQDNAVGLGMAAVIGTVCPIAALILGLGLRSVREAVTEMQNAAAPNNAI